MTEPSKLSTYVLRLADDAMVLGQRISEWTSNSPNLEEDIANSNVALDYLGRARMLYAYAATMLDTTEDELAFMRDARAYTNLLMHELPKGDYAFSTVRQFFIDSFDVLFFEQLVNSSDVQLAAIAAKTVKECQYHLRRSRDLMVRLGDGTEESHQRMQAALDELWGYRHELFIDDDLETDLQQQGIAINRAALQPSWDTAINDCLAEATLSIPEADWTVVGGRSGVHSEHLGHMLDDMQCLHRSHPGVTW